jgi:hypothetical protein
MMRFIICILLALLSLGLCILCFGTLLISCSGHLPTTAIGIWIVPLSLLGGTVFLYLSVLSWKTRRSQTPGSLKKEVRLLPRKVSIFLASFIVSTIAFFLLTGLMLWLVVNTRLPEWTGYILYALFAAIAICVGVAIHKRLAKVNV